MPDHPIESIVAHFIGDVAEHIDDLEVKPRLDRNSEAAYFDVNQIQVTLSIEGDEWIITIRRVLPATEIDDGRDDGWVAYSGLKAPTFAGPRHLIAPASAVADYLIELWRRLLILL